MNSSLELCNDKPRGLRKNSVEYLITKGLGYCCEGLFFSLYDNADLIAARLGVTPDTVRRHKRWLSEGKFPCRKLTCCQLFIVKEKG